MKKRESRVFCLRSNHFRGKRYRYCFPFPFFVRIPYDGRGIKTESTIVIGSETEETFARSELFSKRFIKDKEGRIRRGVASGRPLVS